MMANKLGLDQLLDQDFELIRNFETMLSSVKPDMTIFYQQLMELPASVTTAEYVVNHFEDSFYKVPDEGKAEILFQLITDYLERLQANACSREESSAKMKAANPRFIPRNYLLHRAIEALEKGDDGLFLTLQDAIKEPYSDKFDDFFMKRPDWASRKAGCSMLSCSS